MISFLIRLVKKPESVPVCYEILLGKTKYSVELNTNVVLFFANNLNPCSNRTSRKSNSLLKLQDGFSDGECFECFVNKQNIPNIIYFLIDKTF